MFRKNSLRFGETAREIMDSPRILGMAERTRNSQRARNKLWFGEESKECSPDGGQDPGTHCAFLTASSIDLGEATALSRAQTIPGSHETAGGDVHLLLPQSSCGGGVRQQAASNCLIGIP